MRWGIVWAEKSAVHRAVEGVKGGGGGGGGKKGCGGYEGLHAYSQNAPFGITIILLNLRAVIIAISASDSYSFS